MITLPDCSLVDIADRTESMSAAALEHKQQSRESNSNMYILISHWAKHFTHH
jgi:hypothetical protein